MSRRCCCVADCSIFKDKFGRANSTNLGSNWFEDNGNSDIVDETLHLPPAARVICTVPHPQWDATAYAQMTMKDIVDGKRYRLIIDFVDDEDDPQYGNYMFAEYEAGAGGEGTLKVGKAVAGVVSYLHTVDGAHEEPDDILEVCRSVGGIYAQTSHAAIAWACVTRAGTEPYEAKPYKAGVENPGDDDIEIDNFEYWQHVSTNPDCTGCECNCKGFCVGKALTLTFDAGLDCSCMDGSTITINWDEDSPGDWMWNGEGEIPNWMCGEGGTITNEYDLFCGNTPEEWRLVSKQGLADSCGGGGGSGWSFDGVYWYAYPSSVSCDPFILTYGPFTCDWSCEPDPCNCEYYLIVT